ncbi:MAG: hypothetical protein ACOYBL_13340 [Lachnospiraceae bacterium]|jgi:hypothetical protein
MADKQQESGFVKISRSILDWEWYEDVVTRCVFIHCILRANWKNTEWKGQKIKRGQFITSLANLARETGFTVQQTRTALDHLKLTGEITNLSTPQCRIITVNNYDKFQQVTKQSTNHQQTTNKASNKRPTIDKEYKKNTTYSIEEKKEGGTAAIPPSGVKGQEEKPFYGEGLDENGFRTYKRREDYW